MRKAEWFRLCGCLALWLGMLLPSVLAETEPALELAKEAYAQDNFDRVIELLQGAATSTTSPEASQARQVLAAAHQRRGEHHFQNGRIEECLKEFNRVVELVPEQAPHHWQRGIACYYAGLYQEGVAQFELHRTVNPEDVENAVWHFLCGVRIPGGSVEAARAKFLPVKGDSRVPMKEIYDLYAGKTTPEAVLAAGKAGGNQSRFYADLYVGLYLEALGKKSESLRLVALAAVNPKATHYMGDVARTHLLVREGGTSGGR